MASFYSLAGDLGHSIKRNPAYCIFGAFLVSVFFLNGGPSNALVIVSFLAAWIGVIREVRAGTLSIPRNNAIVLAFLVAISFRLLLPPYGVADTVPGAAVSRALLLVGLYGLTLYTYSQLPFTHILWMIAGAASACSVVALAAYAHHMPGYDRLVFLGRASHAIIGAGAVATAAIAAATLLTYRDDRRSPLAAIMLALMFPLLVYAIVLTGSRGPMLALALALVAGAIILYTRSRLLLFVSAFGAWALITASVLLDIPIKRVLCPTIELACRPSLRADVWAASVDAVVQHPLWGNGYAFRFEGVPHAHNSYIGMALHYGIPLCILFVALMAVALSHAADMKSDEEKFFVVTTLIFANGFMGSDLSEPLRFFNTHYLFLWFPLFLALVATRSATADLAPTPPLRQDA